MTAKQFLFGFVILTLAYDHVRKASNIDYWVRRVILVRGDMSMLGKNYVFCGIVLFIFMVEDCCSCIQVHN